MKTQLLEDIGENAALPLAPPRTVGTSTAAEEVHQAAPAGQAQPSRPRSAPGVWRHAPAAEPPAPPPPPPPPQSEQEATARELDSLIEELAVLEAQYVPPGRQPEPAPAPAPAQVQPLHEPVIAPAETTLAPDPTETATVPQDPFFDFTTPAPQVQEADPFTPVRRGPARTRRYLLWTAGLLSAVLLIAGGRWLYEERKDGGAPALVAGAAQGEPRAATTAAARAPAAAVTPDVPETRPVTAPPPLVMLEPDRPAAVKPEAPAPAADQAEAKTPPEPVAEQESAAPAPEPPSHKARKESASAARERRERAPARQLARTSGAGTDRPAQRETGMEATLRACREHGYHAAQCIKRDCSVTEYGFVCRGR